MTVAVRELDTSNREHVNRFIDLPFALYDRHPLWVPTMRSEARLQMDRARFPFYERNDAAFFVASRDGRDVGRICAMHPRADHAANGKADAYFYLFDSVDDAQVARALFDAAGDWARERGLSELRGPLGFMAGDGFGVLAKGFQHRPAFGIPYNHPYYVQLVEGCGFEVEDRAFSGRIEVEAMRRNPPERVFRLAEKVRQRYGFHLKEFKSKRQLRSWVVPRLGDIYERAFTHVRRDRHLTEDQLDAIARRLLFVSDPRLLKFITLDDRIVGFLFCFLDVSDGVRRARGRLWPFGWLHILRDLRRTRWVNINGIGMLPEFQGTGGPALMYAELYRAVTSIARMRYAEVPQIRETNHKSLTEMKKFIDDWYKVHHLYRRAL